MCHVSNHRDKLSTCQKPPSMPPELSHRAGGVHWAVKHARLLVVRRLGPPEHPWGPTKWALNIIKIEFKFWRKNVGQLKIRSDNLNLRPKLFYILESAQPRFKTTDL